MDSTTRLDYALFQLTPTRTRCDLVIFAGRTSEKLASGLLQPFLMHLKFAKDQISKGGYSITLKSDTDAPWFSKSTLERFVRFISTPEVLERFVTLEREIAQIQNSILSSEQRTAATESERNVPAVEGNTNKSASFSGSKEESNGTNDAAHEENSNVHLHRVLETRKAVLRKEQAMVYARALVAGFEMDYLNDLICFSDAFGSPRLREACINFMELCKKKNVDRVWRDEVAAMQVCSHSEFPYLGVSRIIPSGGDGDPTQESMMDVHNCGLSTRKQNGIADTSISDSTISHGSSDTNQDNRSQTSTSIQSTDGKAQVPSSWPNHLPQYMQNFQGPMFPNVPPYQGYYFPGMQAPPYYRGNVAWPPNMEDSRQGLSVDPDDHRTTKSSSKSKEKPSHGKEPPYSDLNDSTDGSDSHEYEEDGKRNSSTEGSCKRRHAKNSSRKFVIRNINYITPKRDGEQESASEDGFIDGDSFKQQVEKAVESLERHHKSTLHSKKKQDGSKKINGVNSSNRFTYQDLDKVLEYNSEDKKKSEHWDMFQNLIMRDVDSRSRKDLQPVEALEHVTTMKPGEGMPFAFDEESEKVTQPRALATDSFVITQRDSVNKDRKNVENFEAGNGALSVMKKDSTYEELFTQRIEEPNNYSRGIFSESATKSSTIKSQKEGDLLLENVPDKSAHMFDRGNSASYVEDRFHFRRSGNDLVDDSLVVQARVVNDSSDSQQRTDIIMVSDFVGATEIKNSSLELPEKVEATSLYEPDDLCMVLERDSAAEQSMATWTPEMDYGDNNKTADSVTRHSDFVETKLSSRDKRTKVRANQAPERKGSNKEAKSKASVRSLGKSKSEIELRSNKFSGTKPLVQKSKSEMEEEKRKKMEELLIQRQKRIAERSTSTGFTPAASKKPLKDSKTEVASSKTKKSKGLAASDDSQNVNKPVLRSSTIDRLATARVTHKLSPTVSNRGQPAISKENGTVGTSLSQKLSGVEKKKPSLNKVKSMGKKPNTKILDGMPSYTSKEDATEGASALPVGLKISRGILSLERVDDPENIKNSHYTFPVKTNGMTIDNEVTSKVSPVRQEDITVSETQEGPIPGSTMHSLPISVNKNLDSISFNVDNDATLSKKFLFSTEISVIENSTPPPSNEMSPEPSRSRRKWENTENSPTLRKGFRKLMLFGRKSLNSNVK